MLALHRSDVSVKTDDGQRMGVPASYVDAGDLTHGYAMTIHKSQGMTCYVSLVLATPGFVRLPRSYRTGCRRSEGGVGAGCAGAPTA